MAGIYKKNDIRGVYGTQLTEELMHRLAISFYKLSKKNRWNLRKIAIAGDSRLSTPSLKKAMSEGFASVGVEVLDLGVGPTPMIYFTAANEKEVDAGIIITASHNPKEYNGVKICDDTGAAYHYDNLYSWLERNDDFETDEKQADIIDGSEYREKYYSSITKNVILDNRLKVIVEVGNGSTGEFIEYLRAMGCEVDVLNQHPDGDFPVLLPDPSNASSFEGIQKKMEGYDIGVVFDGDGDRVGFCTTNGTIVSPDRLIMIYADEILGEKSGQGIIIDIKISKATADYIESRGGEVILCKVGHSWIHEKLIEESAAFAGELSGHYYFNDRYHGFDDGLYAAIRFIEFVDQLKTDGGDLESYVDRLPLYHATDEFRVRIEQETQDAILDKLREYVGEGGGKLIEIDGIRGEFDDGWFIARSSSTEEKLSYRIEGNDLNARDRIMEEIENIIKN